MNMRDDESVYEVDLIQDGYHFKRQVDGMKLYRKDDVVVIANVEDDGRLEVLLNLKILEPKPEPRRA